MSRHNLAFLTILHLDENPTSSSFGRGSFLPDNPARGDLRSNPVSADPETFPLEAK